MWAALALLFGCSGDAGAPPEAGSGGAGSSSSGGDSSTSTGGSASTGTGSGGMGSGTQQPDGCSDLLASDVTLRDIDIFQVVGVAALDDGEAVAPAARNAPLVAARAAVVRARVDVEGSFTSRELGARVTVETSTGPQTFIDKLTIAASSSASDPTSGFLVDLPAAAMEPDASYSVAIVECGAAPSTPPSAAARFPLQGSADLAPQVTGTIKIHFVPFEVAGFVPDTSQTVLDGFRDAILSVYPATGVEMTVGAVVPDQYGGQVDMGSMLVDLGVIQESVDEAPQDTYYYGLVTGAATRAEFCDSCPTGTSEDGGGYRAGFSIGAAFADQKAEDTLIHELGHMHGLLHAPCGNPSLQDPLFPYANADITVEGYDFRSEAFIPTDDKDMMSYCFPRWISDYNYDKLVDWVQFAQGWSSTSTPNAGGGAQQAAPAVSSRTTRCFGH